MVFLRIYYLYPPGMHIGRMMKCCIKKATISFIHFESSGSGTSIYFTITLKVLSTVPVEN